MQGSRLGVTNKEEAADRDSFSPAASSLSSPLAQTAAEDALAQIRQREILYHTLTKNVYQRKGATI